MIAHLGAVFWVTPHLLPREVLWAQRKTHHSVGVYSSVWSPACQKQFLQERITDSELHHPWDAANWCDLEGGKENRTQLKEQGKLRSVWTKHVEGIGKQQWETDKINKSRNLPQNSCRKYYFSLDFLRILTVILILNPDKENKFYR